MGLVGGGRGQHTVDVLVLGAGLGGLLAAAHCARAGAAVAVVERLGRVGGRFATHWRDGYGLSSGALHFVPHGASGPLASMLSGLGIRGLIEPAALFGSVRDGPRHVLLRRPADILRLCGLSDAARLLHELRELKRLLPSQPGQLDAGDQSFAAWLERQRASQRLTRLWQTFADFALSLSLDDVSAREMREVVRNVALLGDPGIVRGGCGAISDALAAYLQDRGGEILLNEEVTAIAPGRVLLRHRRGGPTQEVAAQAVVSDLGPDATARLMGQPLPEHKPARGLKLHLSSRRSHIPHAGIMFWLDGQRLTGAVQPTNVDPGLAPPGRHLLIAFGTLRSGDLAHERRLALQDAHELFGDGVEVLACSTYAGDWPVNRALQGQDRRAGLAGVHLVGDGCKPAGCMMADGVAKSVELALAEMGVPCAPHTEPAASTLRYLRRSLQAVGGG